MSKITTDPKRCGGQPCIRDLRITVLSLMSYLAAGMSEEEILEDFPDLSREDLLACYSYLVELLKERAAPRP